MEVGGERHAPVALSRERALEAQRESGLIRTGTENLAPSIFDPRTVKPVAIISRQPNLFYNVTSNIVHMAECCIQEGEYMDELK
jgi:hypothetical protein